MKFGRGKAQEQPKSVALPDHGDALTLALPSGEQIPARVLESAVNTLLLAITVPMKSLSQSELDGLVLEFTAPHGRVRLQGTVTLENPSEPDVLRMDSPRSVEVLQEREYVRINAACPVIVYCGRDLVQAQSFTVDISGGGFLLAEAEALKIGDEVQFTLTLTPEELPINGRAKVVRVDSLRHRAFTFMDISELDRRRLIHFIFEVQRAERQRGL